MAVNKALSDALRIPEDSTEEDASVAIVALLTSAVQGPGKSPLSLSEIFTTITHTGSASLLDPLHVLPILLPSRDPAAQDIISLVGECCSAKEVVMAAQEAVERLEPLLTTQSDDEDAEVEDEEEKERSPSSQLVVLIDLYRSAVPRLKLRRKTASETIHPLIAELEAAIRLAGGQASVDEGRGIIGGISHLAETVVSWVKQDGEDDILACDEIMKGAVECAITACSRCIQSSISQRAFETCFPRLTVGSILTPGWEEGEKVVLDAINAHKALGISKTALLSLPSPTSLILLAHLPLTSSEANLLLQSIVPILIASIQSNYALDESLALLLKSLNAIHTSPSRSHLPTDTIIPLCTTLPSLASAHPEPATRHLTFRILSLLLSLSPPQLRLQLLNELTTDAEFSQMRVAAVGLVKEAFLEAISVAPSSAASQLQNPFASPFFLQIFGPTLFRPDPPDLFLAPTLTLSEFEDSAEPARLAQALALYYVVLQLDVRNLTGVRDADVLSVIERNLLVPLRATLARWSLEAGIDVHSHANMTLVSLTLALQRVDEAVAAFGHG